MVKAVSKKRRFRASSKHREKGYRSDGEYISPLLCSPERAEELLVDAIGEEGRLQLFNYDSEVELFIQFMEERHEPNTDVKIYHGYHREDREDIEGIEKFEPYIKKCFPKLYSQIMALKNDEN